jgi:CDP-diacylglycerol--serine O-phosphatidyltransferase
MKQIRLAYLLPNLFTAASIFVGFLAVAEASRGHFTKAAWLILLALVFDGLDGRIARLTRTTSRFGVEFDSLADVVSFGMAPAILLYLYTGYAYGKFGVLVSGLYLIFGAIRLARFNIAGPKSDPNVFIGLPIPIAAVFIASGLLFFEEYALRAYSTVLLLSTLPVALLMVSNIRYPSFKTVRLDRPVVHKTLIVLTISASLLYLFSAEGIVLLVAGYILYGLLRAVRTMRMRSFKH